MLMRVRMSSLVLSSIVIALRIRLLRFVFL